MFAAAPDVVIVFLALSVVFVGLALRDYLKENGELTPARKTWILISFIFAAVSIGLFFIHTFMA